MNDTMIAQEPCPNCSMLQPILQYKPYTENGKNIVAPPDVDCKCGVTIRATVPVFKTTDSGYVFLIKPPSAPKRT